MHGRRTLSTASPKGDRHTSLVLCLVKQTAIDPDHVTDLHWEIVGPEAEMVPATQGREL